MNTSSSSQHTGIDAETAEHEAAEHEAAGSGATESGPPTAGPQADRSSLVRPVHDRMLAGVASGIARYLGVDVTIVRIVLVVLAIAGGAGIPLYLAGWLLIPEEGASQSIASDILGSIESRSR